MDAFEEYYKALKQVEKKFKLPPTDYMGTILSFPEATRTSDSGGDDKEWAEARRSALILAESGNLLMIRNRAAGWTADAKELTDAGAAAYKAVEAKDVKALASVSDRIDASCTTCHKHSRPNVFPTSK